MKKLVRRQLTTGEWGLVGFVVAAVAVRLYGVAHSPPGFFADEASLSGHVSCLLRSGVDAYGHRWPLFSLNDPALRNGGEFGPLIIYPSLAWARMFGTSITAFRTFNVVASLVAVFATAGFMRNLLGKRAFVWALVLGLLSPWSFHAGRIAFGTVFSLAYMMAGAYFLTRGGFKRQVSWSDCLLAALMWGAALYFQRVILCVAMLIVALAFFASRRGVFTRTRIVGMGAAICAVAAPLILHTRGSSNANRAESLTILSTTWRTIANVDSTPELLRVFAENFMKHLSPSFLVFHGDRNLRHGLGFVGQLSWPEIALILTVPFVLWRVWGIRRRFAGELSVLLIATLGIVMGIVPSALTTPEALPHANRSIGAEPFFVIAAVVAALLLTELKVPLVEMMIGGTALFVVFFLPRYFSDFPAKAYGDFQSQIREDAETSAKTGSMAGFMASYREWNPRSMFLYFSVEHGGKCPLPVD